MFVLKKIDEKHKDKLKLYNFKHPFGNSEVKYDEWYVDEKNEQSIFCIGRISECILRGDHGESYWEFAFFIKDVLIYVCLYFSKYPYSESSPWNEKNKLRYLYRPETGLTEQELLACIKKAILNFRLDV